jgi:hypothetical protein
MSSWDEGFQPRHVSVRFLSDEIGELFSIVSVAKGRSSFLKKRTKKLLSIWCVPPANDRAPMDKSFLLLFFKKEALAYLRKSSISSITFSGCSN